MLEIVLAAGGMFLEIVLAAMGVHLSLRLPVTSARKLWVTAFALCGALGVALTVLAAVQNASSVAELRSESASLRGAVAEAQERQVSTKMLEALADRSQAEPDEPADQIAGAAAAKIDQLNEEARGLKDRLAIYDRPPRSLTAAQEEALPDLLRRGGACELGIRYKQGDPEVEDYAGTLIRLIQKAGWRIRPPQLLVQEKEAPGVWVLVHSQDDASICAKVLLASLNALGIEASGVEVHALQPGTFDLLVSVR